MTLLIYLSQIRINNIQYFFFPWPWPSNTAHDFIFHTRHISTLNTAQQLIEWVHINVCVFITIEKKKLIKKKKKEKESRALTSYWFYLGRKNKMNDPRGQCINCKSKWIYIYIYISNLKTLKNKQKRYKDVSGGVRTKSRGKGMIGKRRSCGRPDNL